MVNSRLENAYPRGQMLRVWWPVGDDRSVELVMRFPRLLAPAVLKDLVEVLESIVAIVGQDVSEEVRDAGSLYPIDEPGGRMFGPPGPRGVVEGAGDPRPPCGGVQREARVV